jgi:hypothetical protein
MIFVVKKGSTCVSEKCRRIIVGEEGCHLYLDVKEGKLIRKYPNDAVWVHT